MKTDATSPLATAILANDPEAVADALDHYTVQLPVLPNDCLYALLSLARKMVDSADDQQIANAEQVFELVIVSYPGINHRPLRGKAFHDLLADIYPDLASRFDPVPEGPVKPVLADNTSPDPVEDFAPDTFGRLVTGVTVRPSRLKPSASRTSRSGP